MTADGRKIALLVMHSFTPEMSGFKRPWHVGVLWNDDPRLPEPLLAELRRDTSLVVGDNEPYSARDPYEYTLGVHAGRAALPHCSLEVRQDLVGTRQTARSWGRKLAARSGPPLRRRSNSRPLFSRCWGARRSCAFSSSGGRRRSVSECPASRSALASANAGPRAVARWMRGSRTLRGFVSTSLTLPRIAGNLLIGSWPFAASGSPRIRSAG